MPSWRPKNRRWITSCCGCKPILITSGGAPALIGTGVERIATVGEPFDPKGHEAIGQTPVEDDAQVGIVTDEVQAGYKLGGKLLRVAMVHVGAKQ